MREVGLKCIGFIGIPKVRLAPHFILVIGRNADRASLMRPSLRQVINNLAALRKAVDEDHDLSASLPTEPRRKIGPNDVGPVQRAARALWDDIYEPHAAKLIDVLGRSHPDMPVFILDGEYGPLFSPPHMFRQEGSVEVPSWEVGRIRTSLAALSALRAQGGVGPQVTSHVYGLIKGAASIVKGDPHEQGLRWLTTQEGASWVLETVSDLSEVVEGGAGEEHAAKPRESKL